MPGNEIQEAIQIRTAEERDAHLIAELSGQLGYPTKTSQTVARLKRILTDEDHCVLVASQKDQGAIGWIHIRLVATLILGREAEIDGFVVHEDLRGRGVGERLLKQAEAWAIQHGCTVIRLRSNVTRREAHRFYERCGFERVKTSYLFRKALAPQYGEKDWSE
jgi:GNAT superfamily N-acetyltransferase